MNIQDNYKTDKEIVSEFIESILQGSLSPSELKNAEVISIMDKVIKAGEKASDMVYGRLSND